MRKLARLLRARLKKVKLKKLRSTKWIAGIIFAEFGWYITGLAPSTEIAWVTGLLLFTIYLFIFEIVTVDEAAITIMVLLGLSSLLAPIMGLEQGLVDTQHLFDGFASNAVISIIAVMMIGAGLDKTGMMSKVAGYILKIGGTAEGRMIRDPLNLYDMDLPVDGADAFVLTTAERAKELTHHPVLIHAATSGIVGKNDEDQLEDCVENYVWLPVVPTVLVVGQREVHRDQQTRLRDGA